MDQEVRKVRPSPISLEQFEASSGAFEHAVGLPPAAYTNHEFYEFERDAVFGREWICVGRVDQIPEKGDFFTITIVGEPLIVVRTADGAVNVMSSVCQHRAMCITAPSERPPEEWLELPPETSGNCRTFKCPYHWWIYDLDGKLLGAPEMQRTPGFRRGDVELPKLRVEIWKGFIFINFLPDAPPLSPRLGRLDEFLDPYDVENMVSVDTETIEGLPFNWKIMVENFMEGYHPDRLHAGIHDFAPSRNVDYLPFGDEDGAMIGTIRTEVIDGGFNPTTKAYFPVIEGLTEEQRHRTLFVAVPPSLLIGVQVDSAFWFTVQPTGPAEHSLTMSYIFPKTTFELPMFRQLLDTAIKGVELFNNQDLPANTAIQRGMSSRFAPRGRYSWQESVLSQFNTWLLRTYRSAEAECALQSVT